MSDATLRTWLLAFLAFSVAAQAYFSGYPLFAGIDALIGFALLANLLRRTP